MNDIRKHSLTVHDLKEPGRYKPGYLGKKIGETLQTGPLVVIRRHLIAERYPRYGITGKRNNKEALDYQEIPEIETLGLPLIKAKEQKE